MSKMASAPEPGIAEMEAELGQLQARLLPLYAAQEQANEDAATNASAQRSASGAALTDIVNAREKAEAEVSKHTREITPLKQRAEALKRDIVARRRAEQVAKAQAAARAYAAQAEGVEQQFVEAFAALRAFIADGVAALVAANHDEQGGFRDALDLGGLARWIERHVQEAGVTVPPLRGIDGTAPGVRPTESASYLVAVAETIR